MTGGKTGNGRDAERWNTIRKRLAARDKATLIALVKDLHDLSGDNRDFIRARCRDDEDGSKVLERYRRRIIHEFFPVRGLGKLKLGEARRAIREYRKATGSIPGVVELLMTYAENGAEFTTTYGDIDERFYNSVESVLGELADLLRGPGRELYADYRDRLADLEDLTAGVGWGFHDFISDLAGELEKELGPKGETGPNEEPGN